MPKAMRLGGEFCGSDVFVDRRLPAEIAFVPVLHRERLGGAMDDFDFSELAKAVGFRDLRIVESGPIAGSEALFTLDNHHTFELNRPERVCSNTAMMLRDTRFGAHFEVIGDTRTHFGVFDCAGTMATARYAPGASAVSCC